MRVGVGMRLEGRRSRGALYEGVACEAGVPKLSQL